MQRVLANLISSHIGQRIRIRGWIHNIRSLGKLHFLIVRDRKGLIQVVIEDRLQAQKLQGLHVGSVVTIFGDVAENLQTNLQVEIINPDITVEVSINEAPSIEYTKSDIPSELDHILDYRALSLRNRKIQAVFILQAEIVHAYRQYMYDTVGAVEYFSPNILGASSEGGAEFFNVDYFGYNATLAQSSQLYKQVMVGVNERVFALMPFFRAEKSHTTRHLSEGKQFEFEMGFFDDWTELMDIQEGVIKAIIQHLKHTCANELQLLDEPLIQAPSDVAFPRVTFAAAQEIYFARTGIDERQEDDLSPAAEKELCRYARETYGTDLIFITDWLTCKRPFYSYPSDANPNLTNTFDLLCNGTEITSGGQRRHTYASMLAGIALKGMDPQQFDDYLSIFKYGMPPHGGFGMGLERLTMTLLQRHNIRETSLFPSDPKRIAGNRLKAHVFFGAENIRNEIIRRLKEEAFTYQHKTHVIMQAEETICGIKSIILRGKQSKKNYQFNLPKHMKLDMKMVANVVKERCEFEQTEVIRERFGLEVGAIPPCGNLLNIDTYFASSLQQYEQIEFNCGLLSETIVMATQDLITLVSPIIFLEE